MKTIISTMLLMSTVYAETQMVSKISPELDNFMTLQPIPERYFEHNAYVGWMGLTYPKDNWLTVYRDIFQANDAVVNENVNSGRVITNYFVNPKPVVFQLSNDQTMLNDLFGESAQLIELQDQLNNEKLLSFRQKTLDNKRYRYTKDFFVCGEYLDDHCLDKMIMRRSYIEETIQNNQVLLNRFEELVQTSQYNYALFYNDYNASVNTVPSSGMIKLIQLYLADAMMKIVDGHRDKGLEQLVIVRQWIDLMFHEQSKAALLHFFVNISVTQFLDQTINVLLDKNLLSDVMDDERLQFIIRPYPNNIGEKLNEVVLFEMKQNFKDFAYPYLKVYVSPVHDFTFTEEDEFIILSYLKNSGVILSPELQKLYAKRSTMAKNANWAKVRELQKATQSIDKIWFGVVHQAREAYPNMMDQEEELALLYSGHEYFLKILTDWHQQYFQILGIYLLKKHSIH